MPINVGPWFDAATKPLHQAYSVLTSKKVTYPLFAASLAAPIVGSALASKHSRKERLKEFVPDEGQLADQFNAKVAGLMQPKVEGPKSPVDAALTGQHQRDNTQRPDPAAMRDGLDGIQALMQQSKKQMSKGRGASNLASLV